MLSQLGVHRRWSAGRMSYESQRPRLAQRFLSLRIEHLEDRRMLSIGVPDIITVGRSVSAWSTQDVQNGQVKIDYTVYNDQAVDATGVLLTTTLRPGVTLIASSQAPDQNGQELAWSLGTVPAFGRASVEVTVSLTTPVPLQLDGGAAAFGTVDAGAVSDNTPAAILHTGTTLTAMLGSTPDANTADPFIQQQAAELNYDPQQILSFLQTQIGYESYTGSVRGARGTLWSSAGNSLDASSLGVALMRASGIPAQYAEGTLSDAVSGQLIVSMFPASFQTVGYIPSGTQVSDPAHDPQLLGETRDHFSRSWAASVNPPSRQPPRSRKSPITFGTRRPSSSKRRSSTRPAVCLAVSEGG
jgi:large repetitive protein